METPAPSQPTDINSVKHIAESHSDYITLSAELLDSRNRWLGRMKFMEKVAPGVALLGLLQTVMTVIMRLFVKGTSYAPIILSVSLLLVGLVAYLIAYENACTKRYGHRIKRHHDNAKADEIAWAHSYASLLRRFELFNRRLGAVQKCNAVAGPGQLVDADVVRKYAEEHDSLLAEQARLIREHALLRLMEAINADDGVKYRDTRDISDIIYAAKVRVEDESAANNQDPITRHDLPAENGTVREKQA